MALINCPECGKQVSDSAPSCPHCGYPQLANQKPAERVCSKSQRKNNLIGWAGILLAALIVTAIAFTCGGDKDNNVESTLATASDSTGNEVSQEDEQQQIESAHHKYDYQICKIDPWEEYQCTFTIRIPKELKESELKEIAQQVRKDYPVYFRLYIFYFLPDMPSTEKAWASSIYDPKLKIQINGVTNRQEVRQHKESEPSSKILGKWHCNTPGVKHTITIYKDGNKLKAKQVWPFGFEDIETIREGRNGRYDIINNNFGEHYILKSTGILELWDRDGKFAIATQK